MPGLDGAGAIQLAKHFGADVTGVCSADNVELVKSLGADRVIDYTKEDFAQREEQYDLIFDAVGKASKSSCKNALAANGAFVTVASLTVATETTENMLFLMEMAVAGKLTSVIDRRYPLEQMAEAHRYVDEGHKKGNVVITV